MSQLSPADPIVILSYVRTPMGAMQGALAEVSATDLGAIAVKAAVERAGVDGADIDRAYIGCVLPAGLGQAPARQAAIKADRHHGRRSAGQRHHRHGGGRRDGEHD
jgi:acetyl-CoA C-acetyltransferase